MNPPSSFLGLGIAPHLLEQLDRLKLHTPTPIQTKAIPEAIEGKDLIGIAQTGTGKTYAFGIPLIQRLAGMSDTAQGLILLPTRELAEQVQMSLKKLMPTLSIALIIGGVPLFRQIQGLRRYPRIIVATPGRLLDLMQSNHIRLHTIRVCILDEADRMLDMGFAPQINQILGAMKQDKQMMLFSATMPPQIARIATQFMAMPLRVEVAPSGTTNAQVVQELFITPKEQKNQLLEKLLAEYKGSVLIFSRTKHGARKLTRLVSAMGHTVDEIHSNRSLAQRRQALEGFKSGKNRILVATDIAARGIDVTGIELVINYDLPDNPDDYVHRIGRTGRAGRVGKAISFATPDQAGKVNAIKRLIRVQLQLTKMPTTLPPTRHLPKPPIQQPSGRYSKRTPSRSYLKPRRR